MLRRSANCMRLVVIHSLCSMTLCRFAVHIFNIFNTFYLFLKYGLHTGDAYSKWGRCIYARVCGHRMSCLSELDLSWTILTANMRH